MGYFQKVHLAQTNIICQNSIASYFQRQLVGRVKWKVVPLPCSVSNQSLP